jgi:hypothetical protein
MRLSAFFACALLAAMAPVAAESADTMLFDFEDAAELGNWKPVKLPELKTDAPAPKFEFSTDSATSGKSCLKMTFAGWQWATIGTTVIPVKGNWKEFQTLKADLTLDRPGIAYFRICQGQPDAKGQQPTWQHTMFLDAGRNAVVLLIRHGISSAVIDPARGEITSFIIGMFQPQDRQTLRVDNVRLGRDWPAPQVLGWTSPYNHDGYSVFAAREYERTKALPSFKVLGTDMQVSNYEELAKKLKDRWVAPPEKSIEQVEAEFKAVYDDLKKQHPGAVMAILRDGEKGFDPASPDRAYAGWKMAYLTCHGPDGPHEGREMPGGIKWDMIEAFMRHRSALMQADLSSIPRGSKILAARLIVPRVTGGDAKAPSKANLWVAEPCNREWDEKEANCYYYAKGKQWRAVSGLYYGQDPDFLPVLLTHGPGASPVNVWDFTAAVKFWLEEGHANHGFFLYGDSNDYMRIYTHKTKEIRRRPGILVVYAPK